MKIEFKIELSPGQSEKLEQWQKAHKTIYGEYGSCVYSFEDSGINTFIEIRNKLSNQSITFLA
jgi:hypothetical protein